MSVVLETTLGNLIIDLYYDERPICCKNFLLLCKMKYYNFCLFHSIQTNFIAQSGDPTGTGRGGESIYKQLYGEQATYFDMEKKPIIKHRKRGCISMVNNKFNQHGSQFFLTLFPELDSLDDIHTVFGEVVDGFDVLDKLSISVCNKEYRPYHDIRILHTVILNNPYESIPTTLKYPSRSPSPTLERIQSSMISFDELFDEGQINGKTDEETKNYIEEKEAQARAQILELIGDLPEADIKPPENVLFVCKLNQITTDEDLETIFSRFGEIISCEIVRDKKTNESLCYAFIEYVNQDDCEQAYFKMDNVLIDDRRIRVDFSQSVAKSKWELEQKQRAVKGRKQQSSSNQQNRSPHSSTSRKKNESPHRIKREQSSSNQQNRSPPSSTFRKKNESPHRIKREYSPSRNNGHNKRRSPLPPKKRRSSSSSSSSSSNSPIHKSKKTDYSHRHHRHHHSSSSKHDRRKH
ncbi:unnamed protein product [Didymodactylos carnosus]|uniref:Peptidyl-prolyl cis-trans isomerase n=1 Tax=Didymodactylos carnosus TaxID=1234261 RepID=A0A813TVD6_9BILA|nr:unnamed protein product [Didymodactylos carnosus]CAF1198183.1 unnamed protein product [Didymodactylos carnosus]CAF3605320.1 unnamed protein product [Didymodactylos carnosus]CAF4008391.1 unnamed protein product [Didymodactylos carnosus]